MRSVTIIDKNILEFSVWAPLRERMTLHVVSPFDQTLPMQKDQWGTFRVKIAAADRDIRYLFKPEDEIEYPDPASQYQPEGVHGPSQVVDHSRFKWTDGSWNGLLMQDLVLYELHVGTFTAEGTFTAIISRLDALKACGINALELMPVAQFPGTRNWGYDGVFPYAVQHSYGGPDALKKLINACHEKGMAVFLDVVYNHLGPEGNYLSFFGPYFTNRYCTPWGDAINFDDEWSDGVREFFSDNAIYWLKEFHLDGLRVDAIHTVFDQGAVHFWELLHDQVNELQEKLGRLLHLIAESDLNSPKVVKHPQQGGYGFDAQWLDDFHHALYVLVNPGDRQRYYDFGSIEQLAKAYTDGFVHSGEWVQFRKRRHGASSAGIPGDQFIAFNLNHDQAGNRAGGERLCMLVPFERVKLAAAALFMAPYIPMLFMGEEYGDDSPFYYFTSHSDQDLIHAVRDGRKKEFSEFGFNYEVPDPQAEETFNRSGIHWEKRNKDHHRVLLDWHCHLIRLRRTYTSLKNMEKEFIRTAILGNSALALYRESKEADEKIVCLFNFSDQPATYVVSDTINNGKKILDSKEVRWMPGTIDSSASHTEYIKPGQTIIIQPWAAAAYLL